MQLTGIHHVSALTADAVRNVAFYTQTIGMRLAKKTVNQDDTSSYHLFYTDAVGSPGTDLTFFDIPGMAREQEGIGSISAVSLRVRDRAALAQWQERLEEFGVEQDGMAERAGRASIAFRDFEGQHMVLVADDGEAGVPGGAPWERGTVPAALAVRGLGPVTLTVRDAGRTGRVLTDILGFRDLGSFRAPEDPARETLVFATGAGGAGAEVHVVERRDLPFVRLGRGSVHHVAFRVPDDLQHAAWLERLEAAGLRTSGIVDRYYFHSIYFREPNGVLYELATDGPGFDVDEDMEHLGERLALPPFLEPMRQQIEARLHPLEIPRP